MGSRWTPFLHCLPVYPSSLCVLLISTGRAGTIFLRLLFVLLISGLIRMWPFPAQIQCLWRTSTWVPHPVCHAHISISLHVQWRNNANSYGFPTVWTLCASHQWQSYLGRASAPRRCPLPLEDHYTILQSLLESRKYCIKTFGTVRRFLERDKNHTRCHEFQVSASNSRGLLISTRGCQLLDGAATCGPDSSAASGPDSQLHRTTADACAHSLYVGVLHSSGIHDQGHN